MRAICHISNDCFHILILRVVFGQTILGHTIQSPSIQEKADKRFTTQSPQTMQHKNRHKSYLAKKKLFCRYCTISDKQNPCCQTCEPKGNGPNHNAQIRTKYVPSPLLPFIISTRTEIRKTQSTQHNFLGPFISYCQKTTLT